jgi:mannose-6-phosphate isomerase-like protein (cupin superfamily)
MTDEARGLAAGAVDLGRPGWTMHVSGAASGGTLELFEERRDATGGPPPHVHRGREELFHVLEGRYVFVRDREEIELSVGDSILIPRGTRHHFRTLVAPSRTLIVIAPAGLEGFFREMGAEIAGGKTALEAMTMLSARYDSHPVD